MRALLDTHTFLWWVNNDQRLSERVREIIGDGSNSKNRGTIRLWFRGSAVQPNYCAKNKHP
jgi:PIN domain nuclease of toxin-antitoxin system